MQGQPRSTVTSHRRPDSRTGRALAPFPGRETEAWKPTAMPRVSEGPGQGPSASWWAGCQAAGVLEALEARGLCKLSRIVLCLCPALSSPPAPGFRPPFSLSLPPAPAPLIPPLSLPLFPSLAFIAFVSPFLSGTAAQLCLESSASSALGPGSLSTDAPNLPQPRPGLCPRNACCCLVLPPPEHPQLRK